MSEFEASLFDKISEKVFSEPTGSVGIISNRNRITPEAERFFEEAIRYRAFSGLDFRTTRIIDTYIGTDASYADLSEIMGVTRARIGQIITKGVNRLLTGLPIEVREQFQKPLIIKSGFSDETRAKISEAHKGRPSPMAGRQHSPETRAKISEAHKGHWKRTKALQEVKTPK